MIVDLLLRDCDLCSLARLCMLLQGLLDRVRHGRRTTLTAYIEKKAEGA